MKLTKSQRELKRFVEEVKERLGLSTDLSRVDREFWTPHLRLARQKLISSAVLSDYLLMDQLLNGIIWDAFFPGNMSYTKLWRTKKFKAFNYWVLERIFLIQKVELCRPVSRMPEKVRRDLLALNDLRNALAHSFFPENRRVKPKWKKNDIFSRAGFDQFSADMGTATGYFVNRILRLDRAGKDKRSSRRS